ncbi:MAG: NADP oxidoreductase [Candidatus Dadabacteria bacterium]|nr:NADP oxidoreductase [Candidatus Dadabacteria bacterium]MYA48289.1 NADP oxidoreductase [Candidatus Dadabacteria bacterium]MYK48979.1 NADP oxidoreductase [Candidatus Dadabacteria bacterium]
MNLKTVKVAIVGSGPAAFYAADHLQKKLGDRVFMDMFEKLPTPHGLVRSGVAPDHQKIKSVARVYDKIASNPQFRFFGLVEFGKHLTLEDLRRRYHQIVIATGAQTDRKMGIPGENLIGSHTATEFVGWYNTHPDHMGLGFDFSGKRVVIVGVGNVAVDVARILSLTRSEMEKTDIADYALEELAQSGIREIQVLGRRGPAQAAFTNPELRELENLEDADLLVLPDEAEPDSLTLEELERKPDRTAQTKIELIKKASERVPSKSKKIIIRFLVSPTEIIAGENNKVKSVKVVKNRLYRSDDGSLRPKPTNETEEIPTDLVFRSVGYRGIPLPDVPFDDSSGVIPNEKGRVLDETGGNPIPGLYTTGWIKRGPTGVIGTNKTDSGETVSCMVEDIEEKNTLRPELISAESIKELLDEKHISYNEWLRVDSFEKKEGEKRGRPRVKVSRLEEILEILEKEH